ncbi:hypothetical protein ACFYMB_31890 [Micromonospora haikouensis]|uniref:hypothetical protein n=1 Tax=Micromonospora haikouensis TaxID=686309 RepID=UPI00369E653D
MTRLKWFVPWGNDKPYRPFGLDAVTPLDSDPERASGRGRHEAESHPLPQPDPLPVHQAIELRTVTPPGEIRSRMRASTDPYLLRLLLWCEICDRRMICGLLTELREIEGIEAHVPVRIYNCAARCRTEDLIAEAAESLAWNAAERRATLCDIRVPYRQSVLEMLMVRAEVGRDTNDIRFIWKF